MLDKIKFTLGAALFAASQLAVADAAEVKVSNLTLTTTGGEWWSWVPGLDENGQWPNWVSPSAGVATGLVMPEMNDARTGWQGQSLSSFITLATSAASAQIVGQTVDNLNGVAATASVMALDGQSGWAFAKVFDGQILVSGNATITLSMKLNSLTASGAMSQANAWIELCSTDFTTDTCLPANYAEAVVFGDMAYGGPATLTASWTNPGATTWAKMRIGLTASADSVTAVPEPTTSALWLAGLAGVGAIARRRRQR